MAVKKTAIRARKKLGRRARLGWRQITGIAPRIRHAHFDRANANRPDISPYLPVGYVEPGDDVSSGRPGVVVAAIVILAIAFIIIITYYIAQMPPKAGVIP